MSMSQHNTIQICQPIELEFRDVYYTEKSKHGLPEKRILDSVYGRFQPGKMTAVLGPSGAGKTTLMNVLSGFRTLGVKGKINVNGRERVLQLFRKQCSYITQDFAMLDLLTVVETFKSTADLKLGPNVSNEAKFSMINEIGHILGLKLCFHTQVGQLSGGEKKRLSIGLELLTNPPIMIFDEPTSGLDSSSSVQVISHLRTLAQGGRTVVCVIHQPSSRLFDMFDEVYILVGGRTLFAGPVEDMVPTFETIGHFQCPKYYNRADFAIEVACKERGEDIETLFSRSKQSFDQTIVHKDKQEIHTVNLEIQEGIDEASQSMLPSKSHIEKKKLTLTAWFRPNKASNIRTIEYPAPTLTQFWVLLKRTFLCTCIRDLHMAQIRIAAQLVVGFLMGIVFYNMGNESSKIQSNTSFLFFSLMFIFFSNSMPTVQTFPAEAAVFFREHLNNWYSIRAYYFSRLAADLPLQLLCPTIYFIITYLMTNQPLETDRFVKVLILGVAVTIMAQALGHFIGAAFDAQLGTFLIPASAIPMFLFSGFFIMFSDLPYGLLWMTYVSYFRYPFEGLMLAIYGNNRPNLKCSKQFCYINNPKRLLSTYDLVDNNFWIDILGITVWILVLRLGFYLVLRWKLWRIRGY